MSSRGLMAQMPEISRFYGLVIKIFYDDHNPPHFHAEYGEYEVLINITTLAIMSGRVPARALGMVTEWAGAAPGRTPRRLGEGETAFAARPDRAPSVNAAAGRQEHGSGR